MDKFGYNESCIPEDEKEGAEKAYQLGGEGRTSGDEEEDDEETESESDLEDVPQESDDGQGE